jgi:hypothetical protein
VQAVAGRVDDDPGLLDPLSRARPNYPMDEPAVHVAGAEDPAQLGQQWIEPGVDRGGSGSRHTAQLDQGRIG